MFYACILFIVNLLFLFPFFFFFFNDTATTEIYTLSLHDALPISEPVVQEPDPFQRHACADGLRDRKSTRLNSSHANISYAVFCLKKQKNKKKKYLTQKKKTKNNETNKKTTNT